MSSTPARIAERHDPLFTSCVAGVSGDDLSLLASHGCRGLSIAPEHPESKSGRPWGPNTEMSQHIQRRQRLHALNAAQDRAAMANAADEGSRAA